MLDRAQAPSTEEIREVVTPLAGLEGPLLPMLHALQDTYGLIPEGAVPVLADLLNLGRAEVHGVISFYHDFRDHPAGRHVLKICRAEACQSVGAESLYAATRLACADDQDVEVSEVFCLGNCALGPSGMVDGRLLGRLTPERVANVFTEDRHSARTSPHLNQTNRG